MSQTQPMSVKQMRAEYDAAEEAARQKLMKAPTSPEALHTYHAERNAAVNLVSRWLNRWRAP